MNIQQDALALVGEESPAGRLELKSVVKTFSGGEVRAVDGVDLTIESGEFITLLGPSGCGKTTTLRIIAGFEDATSGHVLLDGADMVVMPPNKRPMAMVFQSYALFPHMSVRDNVAYGLTLQKLPAPEISERVELALTSMNLNRLADRAPNQLSGGQQQRVALARAMVVRPKVLLFDEPLSNLDAKLRVRMRQEIRNVQRQLGITSVYVTHDQAEAMSLADRIVVMNAGRIEQVAAPSVIYRQPESMFVADFIGQANFLAAQVISCDENSSRVRVLEREITVPSHRDVAANTEAQLLVRPESLRIERLTDETASVGGDRGRVLETVFYGGTVEYEVETDFGSVVVVVSDPRPDEVINEGAQVRLTFDPMRSWLLAK